MITEDDLRESLRALERLAPEPAPVAARIAAGVRTQGRRRTAVMVAAAAATAAAVALPIALLGRASDPTTAAPTPTPTPAASSAAPVAFDPLTVPFTVGWLPAGWHASLIETNPGWARRSYEGPAADDRIAVEARGAGASPTPAPGSAGLERPLGGTALVTVTGTADTSVLKRVLASVRRSDDSMLTFPFRLTWVPDGYRLRSASSGRRYWIGDAAGRLRAAVPPLADTNVTLRSGRAVPGRLSIGVSGESDSFAMRGFTPNGTFLGRPSCYSEKPGSAYLLVYGLHGTDVSVTAETRGHPELTRAALERVATGLRLVPHPADPATWTAHPLP